MEIVIGTTTAPYKATSGEDLQWLADAENMIARTLEHPEVSKVYVFAALEVDGRGLSVYADLLERFRELDDISQDVETGTWTFSIDDGDDEVHGGNRLFRICTGRNLVHEYAQRRRGVSHIMFIDSDLKVPADSIVKLLEVDKPLAGGDVPAYCVDPETEALTDRGWLSYDKITLSDRLLTCDPSSGDIEWSELENMTVLDWDGPMFKWHSKMFDALSTPNHRWVTLDRDSTQTEFKTSEEIVDGSAKRRLVLGGGHPKHFPEIPTYSDEMVELIGWTVTEGTYPKRGFGVVITQSEIVNPEYVRRIRQLGSHFRTLNGATCTEWNDRSKTAIDFNFGKGIGSIVRSIAPNKQLTPEFLLSLTYEQAILLYDTLMAGDGAHAASGQEVWGQKDLGRVDSFQMLCAMLAYRSRVRRHSQSDCNLVGVYSARYNMMKAQNLHSESVPYAGKVWCPTVRHGVFMARRHGVTYWTGNCLGGPQAPEFPFPVQNHWNTAGYLLVNREIFRKVRWRTDHYDIGATDDPCFAGDVGVHGLGPTYVRKDIIGIHGPLVSMEDRGHDRRLRKAGES